jgi:hypothetical protein
VGKWRQRQALQIDGGSKMTEVEFPRRPPLTRDLDRRPIPDDYRPGIAHRVRLAEREVPDSVVTNEIEAPTYRPAEMDRTMTVNLRKLEEQLNHRPLEEIAVLVHGLTYGEMIELAEAIWKLQPDGVTITEENLPALLHRWSKVRSARVPERAEPPSPA